MAVKVTVNNSSRRTVGVTLPNSKVTTATKLNGLSDVNMTDVQDGYTFTYNASTGYWEATPVSGLAIDSTNVTNLDGGTF